MFEHQISMGDALALSRQFRVAAVAIGDHLYDEKIWPALSETERARLGSLVLTLFSVAADMNTEAVGVVIRNASAKMDELNQVTGSALGVIAEIEQIGDLIALASALISLAAAIPTGSAGAILGAMDGLRDAVVEARQAPALAADEQATSDPAAAPTSGPI